MVPDKEKKVKRYIWGLRENIQGNVSLAEVRLANSLMDQKVCANAARKAVNKRRWESNQGNKHVQQAPPKRQNVARAYISGPGEKKAYARNLPYCNKCKLHHAGPWTMKCSNCKRVGHMTRDCRTPVLGNNSKSPSRKSEVANGEAQGRAYALGGGEVNQDPNVVMGTFLLINRYASILFDTGADRSFVSTTFSPLIDIIPTALDTKYVVELADEKIIRADTIIRGCTLNFLNHPFNIDLMPKELGSYDFIISMDWLTKYHVVIVCDGKIVRIPFGNEILTIQGDRSDGCGTSRLNINSCTKTQKYKQKGWHVFLAQISEKKTEKKSKEKRLEDTSLIRNVRADEPTARTGRQRIYKTKFLTLGSSGLVCQEEEWILQDVHRL
ncbi:putative reverse transcriptase domain-containing protein [Tanacetum coccineum]